MGLPDRQNGFTRQAKWVYQTGKMGLPDRQNWFSRRSDRDKSTTFASAQLSKDPYKTVEQEEVD